MSRLSNLKDKVKDRVSRSSDSEDNLGPDRGTMDQLEARKERARMEARQEAQQEQRQQEIQQAREEARDAVESTDEDAGILQRATSAVSAVADDIDIDGDGTSLAAELEDPGGGGFGGGAVGGQPPASGSGAGSVAVEEDLAALENDVNENDTEIDRLEDEVFGDGADDADDPLGAGFDAAEQFGVDDDGGGF